MGSCRNLASHTRACWRTHSLDLSPGLKVDAFDLELMEPLGAGKGENDLVELQGGGAAKRPGRSEESLGSGHQEDDPTLQAKEWSSWLPRVL